MYLSCKAQKFVVICQHCMDAIALRRLHADGSCWMIERLVCGCASGIAAVCDVAGTENIVQ